MDTYSVWMVFSESPKSIIKWNQITSTFIYLYVIWFDSESTRFNRTNGEHREENLSSIDWLVDFFFPSLYYGHFTKEQDRWIASW